MRWWEILAIAASVWGAYVWGRIQGWNHGWNARGRVENSVRLFLEKKLKDKS